MSEIPAGHFDDIRKTALESPDRRFRLTAAFSLGVVASFGADGQRAKAREILETMARSDDPLIATEARFLLEHPLDEKGLERLAGN